MNGAHPHSVMFAAREVNHLAKATKQDKMALVLTAMSVALVGMMAIREFRSLFGCDPNPPRGRRGRGTD